MILSMTSQTTRFATWFLTLFVIFLGCFVVLVSDAPELDVELSHPTTIAGIVYISFIASWGGAQSVAVQENAWRMFGIGVLIAAVILSIGLWQAPNLVENDVPEPLLLLFLLIFSLLGAVMQLGFVLLSLKAAKAMFAHFSANFTNRL